MERYELRKIRSVNELRSLYGLISCLSDADLPPKFPVAFSCREFEVCMIDLLRSEIHDLFSVMNYEGQTLGCVYSYDYRIYDGHCKISFFFSTTVNNQDAQRMLDGFCNYLFCEYPLVKLFFETSILDSNSLSICNAAGFRLECTLKEYHFKNNEYVDWCICGKERSNAGLPFISGNAVP